VSDKQKNLARAEEMIREAAMNAADIIVLPEMFVCPYDKQSMLAAKESTSDKNPGETFTLLSALAKELKVYVIAGIPEEIPNSPMIYNTCLCFDRNG
jgi:predicted amidohydrolase